MATLNLLYKTEIPINKKISIKIPSVIDVCEHEDDYYVLVHLLTAMPVDMMVELDSLGIDFTEVGDFELFIIIFNTIRSMDTKMVFGDLDLSKFSLAVKEENGTVVLLDSENDIEIDRAIANQIASALRKIHHIERNNRKPANKEAKDYMLQRAKEKARRQKNRTRSSQIESLIVAMVNTEQFPYGFEEVKNLTIYQFNESVRQVIKKIDYQNKMHGIYSGTVSIKDLSQDDLNWLTHK